MVPVAAARRRSQDVRNHVQYGRGTWTSAVPPEARLVPAVVLPSIRLVDGESARGDRGQRIDRAVLRGVARGDVSLRVVFILATSDSPQWHISWVALEVSHPG